MVKMMDSVHRMSGDHQYLPQYHQSPQHQHHSAQTLPNSAFHSWHGMGTPATPTSDPSSSGHASSNVFRRQSTSRGSMRKMLPPTPDMDTQLHLSAKMIDKRTSTPKGNHSYGPFFLEYSLLAEYNLLQKQKMPGVYVIPSATSPLCWFGVLFIRQGMYQEGIFRFKMNIPENYPDGDCPRLFFDHDLFHPLVCPETHELDLKRTFHKWKRNVNHLWQILLYTRRIFYKIDVKDPVNREAADLFTSNLEEFKNRVKSCVSDWQSRKFSPPPIDDPHYISFAPYEPEKHEPVMKSMIETGKELSLEYNGSQRASISPLSSLTSTGSTSSGQFSLQSQSRSTGLSYIATPTRGVVTAFNSPESS